MGQQSIDDDCTVDDSASAPSETFELSLTRQSTADYSTCSSLTYDFCSKRTPLLEFMQEQSLFEKIREQQQLQMTSHTKLSMESDFTGLEIATPLIGNHKKVGAQLRERMEEFAIPFDPHDDSSVFIEELDDDDGFTFYTISTRDEEEDMVLSDDQLSHPPPAPPIEMGITGHTMDITGHEMTTPVVVNGRKMITRSPHSTAEFSMPLNAGDSAASFVVEELNMVDDDDEFTYKTISNSDFRYTTAEEGDPSFISMPYSNNLAMHAYEAERTSRQSNRTTDVVISYADLCGKDFELFEYETKSDEGDSDEFTYKRISSSAQKPLDPTKEEVKKLEDRSMKKNKSERKLKKESSSRSKKPISQDRSRSLKKKDSNRKLKKDSSSRSKKLFASQEADSSRTVKKSNRKKLKKDASSRSKQLVDSQEADSSRTVKKSNRKLKKSSSSRKKLVDQDPLHQEHSPTLKKKQKSSRTLKKSSSKRSKSLEDRPQYPEDQRAIEVVGEVKPTQRPSLVSMTNPLK